MPRVPKLITNLVLATCLILLLTACGTNTPTLGLAPSKQIVQKAIALQVKQTQQKLTQRLHYSLPKLQITQVTLKQVEPLFIENLPGYHFRGSYTLKIELPQRRINQRQRPFDIYIQRQQEGKTWRLALPKGLNQEITASWRTYLIR